MATDPTAAGCLPTYDAPPGGCITEDMIAERFAFYTGDPRWPISD